MSIQAVLDSLRSDPNFIRYIAAWERIPARAARLADFPARLDPDLAAMLRRTGIDKLYSHQAQAVDAAFDGKNVVIVTPTASGKTLCYNLPVLQACRIDLKARALYLFPTKALAQDQAAALNALMADLDRPVPVHIYDGDTPSSQRSAIRQQRGIIISNPDMLHRGILPYHTKWSAFFQNLRYIVIDELHAYRGVFGSHVANVMRRLRRICRFYGANPIFLCASATIANPSELAETLTEAPVTLIDENGAPLGEKHFLIYNPPLIEPGSNLRRSYTLESRQIAGRFLAEDIQTLLFARTRLTTEILLGYLRDEMMNLAQDPATVRGYRGGYLPHERREIEQGLRSGEVRGVVATNALELGVDIGQLDAVILAGYPGTIASTWQQAGRAGRRAGVSAAILVASGGALDQYIAQHPRYLFERSVEHARINPDNLVILLNHVRCAAFELPFRAGDSFGSFGNLTDLLDYLVDEEGSLHRAPNGESYRWMQPSPPAELISLRTGTTNTVIIQDAESTRVIGEVDRQSAAILVYEGAVYLHEGRQFLIESLDWDGGTAIARQTTVDYYTESTSGSAVTVLAEDESDVVGDVIKARGLVEVIWQATGYRVIRRYTHETLSHGVIDLPEQRFETTAYWMYLTPDLVMGLAEEGIMLGPNDYGPNWQKQRDATRARDNYRCRRCDAPEKPNMQHHVHHVTPFRTFGYVKGRNDNYLQANQLDNLITLCPTCHRMVETAQNTPLAGLGYVLRNLATLYLMCEPGDIGLIVEQKSVFTHAPTLTLYDNLPAGLGFSDQLYELHDELLHAALDLIRDCACMGVSGCPACVGPSGDGGGDLKALTLRLVQAMIGAEST